jgi:hypothetical protein
MLAALASHGGRAVEKDGPRYDGTEAGRLPPSLPAAILSPPVSED